MNRTRARPTGALLLLLAVCVIAANMRATITGIGPLLDQIGNDLGLGSAALGVLAAVPLIAWAVVSPLAHQASRRFGHQRVVLWSLLLLMLGTVWRSAAGPGINLWAGTVLIGISLAIVNVLMPAVIKGGFGARVPAVTAVYTALLGGIGAIASGVVVPISRIEVSGDELGWRPALLVTGILLPIAIVLWAWTMRGRRDAVPAAPAQRRRTGIWADPLAWQVAGYMGVQAASFYMLVTWLAPISVSLGRSAVVAGVDVMFFQVAGIVGSLLVPVVLRGRMRRWVPALLPSLAILGTLGLIFAPGAVLAWACLSGLSAGASLGMSLTLMAERARGHATAVALSGMAQSVGYVIAAFGPIAFGALHTLSGDWTEPLLLLLAVLLAQAVIGALVGRERLVLERG
ncbi:MAG TPA: MFS transporter [Microbacterium sp.]|uniref:MFS transporter n=1 Tax=Microbacterium sp. TaxID=51671 RepID=UPI002BE06598|nr:MFS transporter [Microbacterium sp.]HWI31981.1 MFS transporter [Microbacterium sp.]